MEANFNAFSKKIKSLRVEKDIFQKEISERLKISVNTYMEYENNPENMKLSMLVDIGNILGVDLPQIFLEYTDTKCIKN